MNWSLLLASILTTQCLVSAASSSGLSASSSAAAQPRKGPLAAAVERDMNWLAATGQDESPAITREAMQRVRSDWRVVTALPPGRRILLRTDRGVDGPRILVFADDAGLIALNLNHPALPGPVRKRLREMAVREPAVLLATRQRTIAHNGDISVGAGATSQSGHRLVALDDVLQAIPRDAIREVRLERTEGSKVGAIAGAAGGVIAGLLLAPHWMMKPCGPSCGDEQFMLATSLVGLPVAGAFAGYLPRRSEVAVYKADGRP